MNNALSLLSQFPDNKAQLKTFVSSFVDAAKNGYNEPLEVLKKLKILEEITKQTKAELKDFFQDDSDNYHEKKIVRFGCEFQKREVPKYDYSVCDDSELAMMENELARLTLDVKARKAFLAGLKDNYINQETGEVIKPPAKSYQSTIAVILK